MIPIDLKQFDGHTAEPWEARKAGHTGILDGSLAKYPAHVVHTYKDSFGRNCTAFVCICSSTTLPDDANAKLLAAAPLLLRELAQAREQLERLRLALTAIAGASTDDAHGKYIPVSGKVLKLIATDALAELGAGGTEGKS